MPVVNLEFKSNHAVSELPLHQQLRNRLEKMGVRYLTEIQAASFKAILSDSDVLMKSQTGSGKTLAYTIPLVQRLAQDWEAERFDRSGGTRCLVIVPTRELVVQCLEVIGGVARPFPHFVPGAIMGGEQRHKEKARLRHGIVTLVCTPGRLTDHLRTTKSFGVTNLRYIVYDEADRILDLGFERDIRFLLEHLKENGAIVRKSVLASATLDLRVKRLAHVTLRDPVMIGYDDAPSAVSLDPEAHVSEGKSRMDPNQELDTDVTVPAELRQHYVVCPCKWRLATLAGFLRWKLDAKQPHKIIVFISNVDGVEFHYSLLSATRVAGAVERPTEADKAARKERKERVAAERRRRKKLRLAAKRKILQQLDGDRTIEDGDLPETAEGEDDEDAEEETDAPAFVEGGPLLLPYNMFRLHGNVDQLERVSVYKAFSQCERGVLFCTDVAARGVDIPGVTWIVQYDTPGEERNYIHRIGRTARIGHVGDSLLFLMPHEVKYTRCLRNHKLYPKQMKSEIVMFHMAQTLGTSDIGSAAPMMHAALTHAVVANPPIQRLAKLGFQAFVRAYATHPKRLKTIFHPNELHLGQVAAAFALPSKPSAIDSKEFRKEKKEDKRALVRRIVQGAKVTPDAKKQEEYIPAIMKKEEKRRKDVAESKKGTKRRALQLTTTSEFDAALIAPPKAKRRRRK